MTNTINNVWTTPLDLHSCDWGGPKSCHDEPVLVLASGTETETYERRPLCLRHAIPSQQVYGGVLHALAPGWAVESDGADWYVTDPSGALVAAS